MATDQQSATVSEFAALGVNRNVSPFLRLQGQWKLVVNWYLEKVGVFAKRDGYTKILNTPDASEILSLIPFNVGTVNRLIMINAAGKLYSANVGTDVTWGSALLTGLDTSARWDSTVMSDASGVKYMILGNGFTTYKTTDGVTFSTVSGAPLAKYWGQLYQRVYGIGVPGNEDVMFWSSVGDLTDWSAVAPHDSSSTNIDKFSNGTAKGLLSMNDRILILKQHILKRWDSENLVTPLCSDGLNAPYSLAQIAGIALYLGFENLYLYDGAAPQPISLPIDDIVKNIDRTSTNIERICGVNLRNTYYLSVGNITTDDGDLITNCWICYDIYNSAFFFFSLNVQAVAMTNFVRGDDGQYHLYFGDVNGNVYEMFSGNQDDTSDISALLKSHKVYPGGPSASKEPKILSIVADPADELKATLIGDDRAEPVLQVDEHVTNGLIRGLGDNNSSFEIVVTHSGKGKPRFYGWEITTDLQNDRI